MPYMSALLQPPEACNVQQVACRAAPAASLLHHHYHTCGFKGCGLSGTTQLLQVPGCRNLQVATGSSDTHLGPTVAPCRQQVLPPTSNGHRISTGTSAARAGRGSGAPQDIQNDQPPAPKPKHEAEGKGQPKTGEGAGDSARAVAGEQQQQQQQQGTGGGDGICNMDICDKLAHANTFEEVFEVVQEKGARFGGKELVGVFSRLAHVAGGWQADERALEEQVHHHPSLKMMTDMAMGSASTVSPQDLAAIIAAAGTLRLRDQDLLDSLTRILMGRMGELEPAMVLQLVKGLSYAGHSPSVVLFDEVQQQERFTEQQREQLRDCFHSLGYDLEEL